LGSPYSGSVLHGLAYIDDLVLTYRKTQGLRSYLCTLLSLRQRRFDLLVDVHSTSRSRQQKLVIGASRSIGMQRGDVFDRLYTVTVPRRHEGHMVGEYLSLLKFFEVEAEERDLHLELPITESHRTEARRILDEHEVARPFVILQATTSGRPPFEVWPVENFSRICEFLSSHGLAVAASGDEKSVPLVESIKSKSSVPVINLAGKTKPLILAALLEQAELYFGYNTGPMHIASAVDCATVALFEKPRKYRPWHPLTRAGWRVLMPEEGSFEGKTVYVAETVTMASATRAIGEVLGF
jgi:ADP-heptose:LPS heptosyltransferase